MGFPSWSPSCHSLANPQIQKAAHPILTNFPKFLHIRYPMYQVRNFAIGCPLLCKPLKPNPICPMSTEIADTFLECCYYLTIPLYEVRIVIIGRESTIYMGHSVLSIHTAVYSSQAIFSIWSIVRASSPKHYMSAFSIRGIIVSIVITSRNTSTSRNRAESIVTLYQRDYLRQ